MRAERLQAGIALVCILATGLIPDLAGSDYWSYSFQLANLLIVAAVLQGMLMDDANQISFGQGAIYGVGAYVSALAMTRLGLPLPLAVICAAAGAGVAGLLYAIPALRVQGYYLGFVTLSLAMVFPELLFALDSITNGINGISTPAGAWKQPLILGLSPLSLFTTGLACAAVIGHVALRHSVFGRRIRVAGASPESAQTLGIRPGLVRSAVFVVASACTGAAGALYPPIVGFVSPAAFHLELSILLFLAVVVGGRGQMLGPIAGIYLLYLLPNVLLVNLIDYRLLAYGVVALGVMLVMPDGLVGSIGQWLRRRQTADEARLSPDDLPVPAAMAGDRAAGPEISIRGGSKTFGAVVALDQVDLDIERGRIIGLVGANGSGKTSLINAITGFSKLSRGSISVRGRAIATMSPAAIARLGIGRTFQTPRIFDHLTAWENIQIGAEARLRPLGHMPAGLLDGLRRRLATAGTQTIPHGQRRSIELLRAVLTGADVLLLDEPAAGLSQEERAQFATLLRRLRDEAGKTILLVEHDLDLVWRIADQIVVMDRGRIVANGAPAAVAGDPAVAGLFVVPVTLEAGHA